MPKTLKILGIETSCDETSAAVIVNGQVRSNVIASQTRLQARFGGVVPEVAAREHVIAIIPTIDKALKTARAKLSEMDYIAVTQGPGLATALMVGIDTAQALSATLDIPLIPINHMEGHIYANFTSNQKTVNSKQTFPALILIVSGGHTMLVLMKGHGQYKILGETVDDAAGEAFDKTAKMLQLPYPGGPQLSKLAEKGNPRAFDFPRPMIKSDNFDFSFSGLKTAVLYTLMKRESWNMKQKANIAASIQQAIVDVLIAKLENAIICYKPTTIMLGGGVAANKLLRERFQFQASRFKLHACIPPLEFCTDNAAMIALTAFYRIKNNKAKFPQTFFAKPNLEM